jgi:AcrR family transcriptional regulator
MLSKAEITTKYILEKVAPIFNYKGYAATSMDDITKATGLTKGAIYGNFKNKEALAIEAFKKNVNDLLLQISKHQELSKSPLQKLILITDFYKDYYSYSKKLGGCPILNVGVDSISQKTALLEEVKNVIDKTQKNIAKLIEWGKKEGEIKDLVDAHKFSKRMYNHIQGAVFMTYTMDDPKYLHLAMDELKVIIQKELAV